jgi:anti-anti-sigma regulatory factor
VTTSNVRVHVVSQGGVTVARPCGLLDLSTHVALRDALLKTAADNPAALVVDLDGLAVAGDTMLAVFMVVAGRIGDWPGIPLLLVARAPGTRALLASAPVSLVASVHGSVEAALRTCASLAPYRYRSIHLPDSALSIVRARLFATDALLAWNLPGRLDDVNQIVAELTGNVVRHARTRMWVRLTERAGRLRISVRDLSPVLPTGGAGGLSRVGALCTHWGAMPTANGKVVWVRLDVSDR